MAQTFHGKWIVSVISKNADFDERFVISGATQGSGAYKGVVGTTVQVDGPTWQIAFEWTGPTHIDWRASADRRSSADFLLDKGLVVTIGVDDNDPQFRDHDYDDLVVQCRNLDPQFNPFVPITNLPDFTYPRSSKVHSDDGRQIRSGAEK